MKKKRDIIQLIEQDLDPDYHYDPLMMRHKEQQIMDAWTPIAEI